MALCGYTKSALNIAQIQQYRDSNMLLIWLDRPAHAQAAKSAKVLRMCRICDVAWKKKFGKHPHEFLLEVLPSMLTW